VSSVVDYGKLLKRYSEMLRYVNDTKYGASVFHFCCSKPICLLLVEGQYVEGGYYFFAPRYVCKYENSFLFRQN
jgi:hypothetical protein